MAAVAVASGAVGQMSYSAGTYGCVTVSMFLFAAAALYMTANWEGDFAGPRFMLRYQSQSTRRILRPLTYYLPC